MKFLFCLPFPIWSCECSPYFIPLIISQIEVGDVICEIETDKATLEFESLEEG